MLDPKMHTFLKVAEVRNYTLAAKQLNLTQPAVTQHMRRLEEHYGCRLVDFSGRQMRLTESGELLHRYAELQLANERRLLEKLAGVRDTLRVGSTLSIADYYLPELLKPYLRGRDAGVQIQVGNTEEMLEACRTGALDCAFIEGIFDQEMFACRVFLTARFLPVARAGHPLANQSCRLADLYAYPLVLRERGSGTRKILENHLYQKNTSPQAFASVLECGGFRMIKAILRETNAVSFMYEQVAREEVERGDLAYLHVEDCAICRPLYFVTLREGMNRRACETFYAAYIAPDDERA